MPYDRERVENEMRLNLLIYQADSLLRHHLFLIHIIFHIIEFIGDEEKERGKDESEIGERYAVSQGLDNYRDIRQHEEHDDSDLLEIIHIADIFEHDAERNHDSDKCDGSGNHTVGKAEIGVSLIKGINERAEYVDYKHNRADNKQHPFDIFPVKARNARAP